MKSIYVMGEDSMGCKVSLALGKDCTIRRTIGSVGMCLGEMHSANRQF